MESERAGIVRSSWKDDGRFKAISFDYYALRKDEASESRHIRGLSEHASLI